MLYISVNDVRRTLCLIKQPENSLQRSKLLTLFLPIRSSANKQIVSFSPEPSLKFSSILIRYIVIIIFSCSRLEFLLIHSLYLLKVIAFFLGLLYRFHHCNTKKPCIKELVISCFSVLSIYPDCASEFLSLLHVNNLFNKESVHLYIRTKEIFEATQTCINSMSHTMKLWRVMGEDQD